MWASVIYGGVHAAVRLPFMKTYDYKHNALMGSKFVAIGLSSLLGVVLFPIYMYNDLNRLHLYACGKNPHDYGYSTEFNDITDILFA